LYEASEFQPILPSPTPPDLEAVRRALKAMRTPRYDSRVHSEPVDGYTLRGFGWDRVYPTSGEKLLITGRNFRMRAIAAFYGSTMRRLDPKVLARIPPRLLCARTDSDEKRRLYEGHPSTAPMELYPWCSILAERSRIEKFMQSPEAAYFGASPYQGLYRKPIG